MFLVISPLSSIFSFLLRCQFTSQLNILYYTWPKTYMLITGLSRINGFWSIRDERKRDAKIAVPWDLMPCGLTYGHYRFEGTCCLHLQGGRICLEDGRKRYFRKVVTTRYHTPEDHNLGTYRLRTNVSLILHWYMMNLPPSVGSVREHLVRFEVVTSVAVNSCSCPDVVPCCLIESYRLFEESCCVHL